MKKIALIFCLLFISVSSFAEATATPFLDENPIDLQYDKNTFYKILLVFLVVLLLITFNKNSNSIKKKQKKEGETMIRPNSED